MVLRVVPLEIKSIDELGLPKVLEDMVKHKQGLVLVTGPTGMRQVHHPGRHD